MLGGGPAAGKSTATGNPNLGIPNTEAGKGKIEAVLVNPDEVKDMIPEYVAGKNAGDKAAANNVHEESSIIAKEILSDALKSGKDVVLDGTGDTSVRSVSGKIEAARAAGYNVKATYVTCPTDVAVQRNENRFLTTGRYVQQQVVENTHASVSRIAPDAASLFDSFQLIDSMQKNDSGSNGKVIAETTLGQPLTVHDKTAYDAFVAKGKQ